MNLDELKRRKKEKGYTNEDLAEVSGVPLGTVQRIMSGATKNPRRATWDALERALGNPLIFDAGSDVQEGVQGSPHYAENTAGRGFIREPLPSYAAGFGKKQGEYTLDDYYALPDDVRAELIDGVIYDLASPATHHQMVATAIETQLMDCIIKKNADCFLMHDIDTQLDCDNFTMVRPDIVLLCGTDKLTERCVYGAPDFVVEVLSPQTRKKDMTIKLQKYLDAGVKVYWMIDVKKRQIIIYDFTEENFSPVLHGLEGSVKLNLPQGECEINIEYISRVLKDVYGI